MLAPEFLPDLWELPGSQSIGGSALQAVDQGRDGDFGRIADEEVDMIILAIEFQQLRLEIKTDLFQGFLQEIPDAIRDDAPSIFCYEDQMDI